ncbi:CoCAF [Salix suchowensis]|nr:CoCAF [Salix suchowensis]
MAPINWFRRKNGKKRKPPPTPGVIVLSDDEDISTPSLAVAESPMDVDEPTPHLESMTTQARLDNVIQTLTSSTSSLPPRRRPSLQYKTFHPLTVRDVMHQLTEAEVAGDDVMVRSILAKLRDRKLLPAKVFIFTDDLRPGYFGTWTRGSRLIGPRTPLVRDMTILDYSNDSGEEWEDENANDADDVNDDVEEDDDSEADSDLESWLVEDEDEDQGVPPDVDDPFVLDVPMPAPLPKRKAVEELAKKKLAKKRKVVVPLVPFCKGPCWEETIGHCESDILKPYRIQLFNDCPFPIDPFTFVSTCGEDNSSATKAASKTEIPTASDVSAIATPMPPPPLPSVPTVKRTASAHKPKTPFPDVHLPFLLSKIDSLHAPTVTYLVEEIFKELRSQNVRKNSIEVKVREVAERCREKKYWIVKPGIVV